MILLQKKTSISKWNLARNESNKLKIVSWCLY